MSRPPLSATLALLALPALLGLEPAGAATPSSGCGVGPISPPSGSQQSVDSGHSEDRTYYPYIPSGYDRSIAYPLVVAFHGTGDEETLEQAAEANIETWGELFCSQFYGNWPAWIADGEDPGIVVCPDALFLPDHDNDFFDQTYAWLHENDDEFFDVLLAELASTYCIDLDRVFVLGHSIGGYFANELACERGDEIRALASIAGGGPDTSATQDTEPADCERGKTGRAAAILLHGDEDDIVPPSEGLGSLAYWRQDNDCAEGAAIGVSDACDTHDTYQGCSSFAGYRVEWCEWEGVGHGQMFAIPCLGGDLDLCGGSDLAQPVTWSFFQGLEGLPAFAELFSDGFENGAAPWDGSRGTIQTTGADPAEGSQSLEIDFDELATVCSAEDEVTVDTNGLPYLLGDATACLRVRIEDTRIAGNATFTGGVDVVLDNGVSVDAGLQVAFNTDAALAPLTYVEDALVPAESVYHASFELNVENLDLPDGVDLDLFNGRSAAGDLLFRLVLTHTGTENRLFLEAFPTDSGPITSTESSDLGSGWKNIEVAYRSGAGDGFFSLSIEGLAQPSLTSLSIPTQLALVRLGYIDGVRDGTADDLWLDDFRSWAEVD